MARARQRQRHSGNVTELFQRGNGNPTGQLIRPELVNRHHILFDRNAWVSNDARKALREDRGLIAPIHVDAHRALHKAVPLVPLLDWPIASRVRKELVTEPGQYVHNMDLVRAAIESVVQDPKISGMQRAIGELAVEAITLQIPFIEEGLIAQEEIWAA